MDGAVNLKEEKGGSIAVAAPFSYGHHSSVASFRGPLHCLSNVSPPGPHSPRP